MTLTEKVRDADLFFSFHYVPLYQVLDQFRDFAIWISDSSVSILCAIISVYELQVEFRIYKHGC